MVDVIVDAIVSSHTMVVVEVFADSVKLIMINGMSSYNTSELL